MPPDEAITSLREITERPDLFAQAAGILAGAVDRRSPGEYTRRIAAARLCVAAGADREALPRWLAVGRRNATRKTGPGGAPDWPDDLDKVLADVLNAAPA